MRRQTGESRVPETRAKIREEVETRLQKKHRSFSWAAYCTPLFLTRSVVICHLPRLKRVYTRSSLCADDGPERPSRLRCPLPSISRGCNVGDRCLTAHTCTCYIHMRDWTLRRKLLLTNHPRIGGEEEWDTAMLSSGSNNACIVGNMHACPVATTGAAQIGNEEYRTTDELEAS